MADTPSASLLVGDYVKVLRACRLPAVEEVVGVGCVQRVTYMPDGAALYWIEGFATARTARELRHV